MACSRVLVRLRLVLVAVVACAAAACSDAEVPQSGFDAGPPSDAGPLLDGSPGLGGLNEPCEAFRCDSNDLICVVTGPQDPGTCRLLCDTADPGDPCGLGFTCGTLSNDQGACLPAGGLDDACPCDEGFACARISGQNVCKFACDPSAEDDAGTPGDAGPATDGGDLDAGPPEDAGFDAKGCPVGDTCLPFAQPDGGVSQTEGACI